MWSNRFCLPSEMWSAAVQTTPERGFFFFFFFFYQMLKPPRGPPRSTVPPAGGSHRFGREDALNTWFPQAAAPGGLLTEGLVPSQMKLDRISANCLLKTVRTVLCRTGSRFTAGTILTQMIFDWRLRLDQISET